MRARRGLPFAFVGLLASCGSPPPAPATCRGTSTFCAPVIGEGGKGDDPSAPTVHQPYGAAIWLAGPEELVDLAVADLDWIKTTKMGAELLARLEGAQAKLGTTARVTVRPRDEKLADDPTAAAVGCAQTGFVYGGFDVRAARAAKTVAVPMQERVDIVAPGATPPPPDHLHVFYNRQCVPSYPDGTPCARPALLIAHELTHVLHALSGELLDDLPDPTDPMPGGSNHEESRTIGRGAYAGEPISENALRKESGFAARVSWGDMGLKALCGVYR
jgi:hypothetical protein